VLQVLQTRQQITAIDLSNNPFYTPQARLDYHRSQAALRFNSLVSVVVYR
jgi:hypothetical protein